MTSLAALSRSGKRWLGSALCVAALVVLSACSPEQVSVLNDVNSTRASHGLPDLAPHPAAMLKAQAWAEHLAATNSLSHSQLADSMSPGWKILGENVGYGGTLGAVHNAFLGSAPHRANIVDRRFNVMGTGVATSSSGLVYVVHVFAQY